MAIANAFFTSLRSAFSDADYGVNSSPSAVFHALSSSGVTTSRRGKYTVYCTLDRVDSMSLSPALKAEQESGYVPLPIVHLIQDSECDATTVEISFGDRLGLLIDTINKFIAMGDTCLMHFIRRGEIWWLTIYMILVCMPFLLMKALKDLGLDVVKGIVTTEGSVKKTKFLITRLDTGRKVEDPDLLERIRLTIISNLIKYHPESSEQLAMGEAFGIKAPEKKPDVDIATHIHIKDDGPKRSILHVETADRSGLLVEVVKIMADINIDVESAEIDTEGLVAKDKFYVSYGGAALNSSLSQVLVNCLRYFLRRPATDEESY